MESYKLNFYQLMRIILGYLINNFNNIKEYKTETKELFITFTHDTITEKRAVRRSQALRQSPETS